MKIKIISKSLIALYGIVFLGLVISFCYLIYTKCLFNLIGYSPKIKIVTQNIGELTMQMSTTYKGFLYFFTLVMIAYMLIATLYLSIINCFDIQKIKDVFEYSNNYILSHWYIFLGIISLISLLFIKNWQPNEDIALQKYYQNLAIEQTNIQRYKVLILPESYFENQIIPKRFYLNKHLFVLQTKTQDNTQISYKYLELN